MAIASTGGTNLLWPCVGLALTTLFFAGIAFYLIDKQKKQQKYAWLVEIMYECRDKPMGLLIDKGGNIIPFAIEHDPKNVGLVKHKKYTLIHPDLTSPAAKLKFRKGPDTLIYPMPGYLPFPIQSSAALCDIAKQLREDERFSWITHELDLIALIFNNTESFHRDAKSLVEGCVVYGDEIPEGYLEDEEEYEDAEEDEYEDEDAEYAKHAGDDNE